MKKRRKRDAGMRLELHGTVIETGLSRSVGRAYALLARFAKPIRLFCYAGAATVLVGCTPAPSPDAMTETEETVVVTRTPSISLQPQSSLAVLAAKLDTVAITRSAAIQERRAAEAALSAAKFSRFPQLAPTGAAPLNSDADASLGLSLEQVIWDAGRIKAQLTDSELAVADAALRAWVERSEMVGDGLAAYVGISRFQARLDILAGLLNELKALDARLLVRAEGGVADRGERLRMAVALQEVLRAVISNESDLRQSKADLTQALDSENYPPNLTNLNAAISMCQRNWPAMEAPADALSSVRLNRAKADEKLAGARRFPRIVVEAGLSTLASPAVGLKLDADDMLGLGRKRALEAANATTQAAVVAHARQLDETRTDLARLEGDAQGFRADVEKLNELIATNQSTLELFREQLEAGSISITQGITIHQENSETLLSKVDLQARLLTNCLQSSELRGVLVPFGEDND
jgi:outer membrane protein TolC